MDFATIIGIVCGATVVAFAIFLGGDFMIFVNMPSVLVVIGGTIGATMIRFPLAGVVSSLVMGGKIAFTQKKTSARDTIDEIARLADVVRRQGPLGLENIPIEDDFLQKGTQYIADGYDSAFILETMQRERDLRLERLEEGKRIFKAMGDAAPAFGMIGTLIGLVQMLTTMDDPSTIGPAMAVALLTTLYGALIANVVCLPIADKLDAKFKDQQVNLSLVIDGLAQIRENKSPDLIKDVLVAYLPEKQRVELAEAA